MVCYSLCSFRDFFAIIFVLPISLSDVVPLECRLRGDSLRFAAIRRSNRFNPCWMSDIIRLLCVRIHVFSLGTETGGTTAVVGHLRLRMCGWVGWLSSHRSRYIRSSPRGRVHPMTSEPPPPPLRISKKEMCKRIKRMQQIVTQFGYKYDEALQQSKDIETIAKKDPVIDCECRRLRRKFDDDVTTAKLSCELLKLLVRHLQFCIQEYDSRRQIQKLLGHDQTTTHVYTRSAYDSINYSEMKQEWQHEFDSIDTYINETRMYVAKYTRHSLVVDHEKVEFPLKKKPRFMSPPKNGVMKTA